MMKTSAILLFAMSLLCGVGSAQDPYSEYTNTYTNENYQIQVSSKNDKFTLWIDAMSLDDTSKKGGIFVDSKQLVDFLRAISEAKSKYTEWTETAKANSVKNVNKEMPVKTKVGGYFLYGRDWKFQSLVIPTFMFKILEDKHEPLLVIRTNQLTASNNQYMRVDGFALIFQSEQEIDDFVALLDEKKIKEALNKPKAEDMFK